MSDRPPIDVWVATTPQLDGVEYLRQGVSPHQTGGELTRAWQLTAMANRRPDLLEENATPRAGFERICLYHVRTERLLETETTLREQLTPGDVLVLVEPTQGGTDDLVQFIKLQGFPAAWSSSIPPDVTRASGSELREFEERAAPPDTAITKYEIHFGDHAVVSNSFVTANTIQESFNSLQQGGASIELRDELAKLHETVADLLGSIEPRPDESERVAADLEELTKEASRPEPRPAFWRRAADGLLEFAERSGEVGTPIVGLVTAIVALLGA
jgi:hypothetical protein